MSKRPSKSQIAKALGVSAPAMSRYVKRGCPTYSIEAAREWQQRNVDPTQRLMRKTEPAPAAAVIDVDARLQLVHALGLLVASDFAQHADALRQALRAVPAHARPRVVLPMDVWHALMPAGLDEAIPPDHEGVAAQSDEDAEAAGAALYCLAVGELVLT